MYVFTSDIGIGNLSPCVRRNDNRKLCVSFGDDATATIKSGQFFLTLLILFIGIRQNFVHKSVAWRYICSYYLRELSRSFRQEREKKTEFGGGGSCLATPKRLCKIIATYSGSGMIFWGGS